MKRISFIVILSLLAGVISDVGVSPATAVSIATEMSEASVSMTEFAEMGDVSGVVSGGSVVTVSSPEELRLFGKYVNGGGQTQGVRFYQAEDISLSDIQIETDIWYSEYVLSGGENSYRITPPNRLFHNTMVYDATDTFGDKIWKPVGSVTVPFEGSYDGGGHSISGMIVANSEQSNGLFSVVGEHGSLCNVHIENAFVSASQTSGCLAARNRGVIKNCSVTGVSMSEENTGGLVGYNAGLVESCIARDVKVFGERGSNEEGVGGVIGRQEGTAAGCLLTGEDVRLAGGFVGGIVGLLKSGQITDCQNDSILMSDELLLGGIVGNLKEGCVDHCYNNATLKFYTEYGEAKCGGIAAMAQRGCYIDHCVNNGSIYVDDSYGYSTGFFCAGGILGEGNGAVLRNCVNHGNLIKRETDTSVWKRGGFGGIVGAGLYYGVYGLQIYNCYNTGAIAARLNNIGGIMGYREEDTLSNGEGDDIQNCYNIGQLQLGKNIGEICGYLDQTGMRYCYYKSDSRYGAYGDLNEEAFVNGDVVLFECYGVTEAQAKGIEEKKYIEAGTSDFACAPTLCEALNNWVENSNTQLQQTVYQSWTTGPGGYPALGDEWSGELAQASTEEPDPEIHLYPGEGNSSTTPGPETTPKRTSEPEDEVQQSPEPASDSSAPQVSLLPMETPSATGVSETDDTRTSQTPVPKQSQLSIEKFQVSVTNGKVKLSWQENAYVTGYEIYRSLKQKTGYQKLAVLKAEKFSYIDKATKKGQTYYYKIRGYAGDEAQESVQGTFSTPQCATICWLNTPEITLSKGKASGDVDCVQVKLKSYEGRCVQIYVHAQGKPYQKVSLKSSKISKYHGVFKLTYHQSKKKVQLYCKVRTYETVRGKKRYSGYSKEKKIVI